MKIGSRIRPPHGDATTTTRSCVGVSRAGRRLPHRAGRSSSPSVGAARCRKLKSSERRRRFVQQRLRRRQAC